MQIDNNPLAIRQNELDQQGKKQESLRDEDGIPAPGARIGRPLPVQGGLSASRQLL